MVKTLSRTIADDTNELPGDAPKPTARKLGFRTQKEAKDSGLFELGEFARHGFEYETYKCDGRWFWRKHDEVKPPTAADLKASGGKKGPKAEAKLRAPRKAVDASEAPKASAAALAAENAPGAVADPAAQVNSAGVDPLAIPDFLMRPKPTAAETEAVRKKLAKVVGPERTIKNPPDAKVAKAKAERKASMGVGEMARRFILEGKSNEEAAAMVKQALPKCETNKGCMGWYRNKLRKDGLLSNTNTPTVKGVAWLKHS